MQAIELNILYDSRQFQWGGIKVSMVPRGFWQKNTMRGFQHFENNKISRNEINLLDANYHKVNLKEVAENQKQLTEIQREMLFNSLSKHENLFQGKLGAWKGPLINIDTKADTKPYHAKPFRILQSIYPVLKSEVDRLEKLEFCQRILIQCGQRLLLQFQRRMEQSDLYLIFSN